MGSDPVCSIKPVCEYSPDGAVLGVEDECRQQSVSFENGIPLPEYMGVADTCECRGEDKFKRICDAGQRQNAMFRPADKTPREKPKEEEPLSPYEQAEADIGGMVDRLMTTDEHGDAILTNKVEYEISDDGGSAKVTMPFLSQQTMDALDEIQSKENPTREDMAAFYESLDADMEYLKAAMQGSMMPGWQLVEQSEGYFEYEKVGGRIMPKIGPDMKLTLDLKKI